MREYNQKRHYYWPNRIFWERRVREEARRKAIEHLGSCCKRCGFSDLRALQIDHVFGGGTKHVRSTSWKVRYAEVLTDTTGKYQLLCANCNWIKKAENNENRKPTSAYVIEKLREKP